MNRIFILVLLLLAPLGAQAERLLIAAASDLRFALGDILTLYRAEYPQQSVEVVYGSSGKMTAQIVHGAPYHVFFSADIAYPKKLHEAGHTATEPAIYAIGRIVLWSRKWDAGTLTLADLTRPEIRRIAIAQPSHAPYGARAEEAMRAAGVWDQVEDKLVFGENIAQTAQMVASEAADVGIIALSLALFPDLAKDPHTLIDQALHEPLTQGYILTRRGAKHPAARDFVRFMELPKVHRIMQSYGFSMPDAQLSAPE